jgi:hypothetical protein
MQQGLVGDAQARQPAQQQVEDDGLTSGIEPATQEEQAGYDKLMVAVEAMLQESGEQMISMMETAESPARAIAEATILVINQLDEQSGGTIPDELIMAPVEELIMELAEMAERAQLFEVDGKVLNQAAQMVVHDVAASFGISQQEIEQVVAELQASLGDRADPLLKEQAQYADVGEAEVQDVQGA